MENEVQSEVSVRRKFNAPAEMVFDAWIKPELMRKWLFAGPNSTIVSIESDFVPYGKFSILELGQSDSSYIDHYGRYYEIDRPSRLVFSLTVPEHFKGETMVTVSLVDKGIQCELTLTQTGVPPRVTEDNWKKMLEQLALTLENQ